MSETNGKCVVTRDDFRAELRRRYLEFQHPVMPGKTIIFQNLTAGEAAELSSKLYDQDDGAVNHRYMFADRMIAMCVDENFEPMFGELDREWLTEMPVHVSKVLLTAMLRHDEAIDMPSHDELKKK